MLAEHGEREELEKSMYDYVFPRAGDYWCQVGRSIAFTSLLRVEGTVYSSEQARYPDRVRVSWIEYSRVRAKRGCGMAFMKSEGLYWFQWLVLLANVGYTRRDALRGMSAVKAARSLRTKT